MDCRKAGVAACISIRIMSVMRKPCHIHAIICIIDFSYWLRRRGWAGAGGTALDSQDPPWLDLTRQWLGMYSYAVTLDEFEYAMWKVRLNWEYFCIRKPNSLR